MAPVDAIEKQPANPASLLGIPETKHVELTLDHTELLLRDSPSFVFGGYLEHSLRNADTGSTRGARNAGTALAASDTPTSTIATTAKSDGGPWVDVVEHFRQRVSETFQ